MHIDETDTYCIVIKYYHWWFHLEKPQMIQQSTLDILEKIKSFKILLSIKKKKQRISMFLCLFEKKIKFYPILSNFIQIYYHSRIPVNNEIKLR